MSSFKAPKSVILKPVITVFGIGGAGGNAINNMILANLQGAKFVVANTDAQSLEHSLCENKIQLGINITKGLGAGASPEIGEMAAEESAEEIKRYLENSNMVFITAGMGGGTGTGASPVIARYAKEFGILTVGVVTKPFHFEGPHRMRIAERGLKALQQFVDTLIIIPNQNLFRIANEQTTFTEAFRIADGVLHAGVQSITDLMIMPGLINLDFADIRTVMSEMGKAMMGTGEATGEDRAIKAAESAVFNPLLDHSSMRGARGLLINVTGGSDMTLFEVDSAANRVREEVGSDGNANIIFGSTYNSELNGIIRVSVVATGIDQDLLPSITSSELSTSSAVPSVPANDGIANEYDSLDDVSIQSTQRAISTNAEDINATAEQQFKPSSSIESQSVNYKIATESMTAMHGGNNTKTSFLSKMWHSLLRPSGHHKEESAILRDDKLIDSVAQSINDMPHIQEVPTFLRKQQK